MPRAKIKLCPFCGKKPILMQTSDNTKYYYTCSNGSCPGNVTTDAYLNKGSATRAWNTRYTKELEANIAKKIFEDIKHNCCTKVIYHGEVIWEAPTSLNELKKKYGVIE